MQAQQGPNDRQLAVIISIIVGAVVAVVTTATFYWIYELASGPERRQAAIAAQQRFDYSEQIQQIVNAEPNVVPEGDPREPWLGADAWQAGIQAGQEYINQYQQPQNVQVLTGLTTAQIWAYMQNLSAGIGVGCQYCHDLQNFASYNIPQKTAGLLMLQLTRDINAEYIVNLPNYQGNYVRCATCHYGEPVNMPTWGPEFEQLNQPIDVNVTVIDGTTGEPITEMSRKPPELQGLVSLEKAILWKTYNYEVWRPYNPADPTSGRGTLALAYNYDGVAGPSQDQTNINQGAMNYMGWSIGEGCTYCHNSRNFYAYEDGAPGNLPTDLYGQKKLKTVRMLLMSTWMANNWTQYAAFSKGPADGSVEPLLESQQYLKPINDQYWAMTGCYTCHRGNAIPLGSLNEASIPEGEQGVILFPETLRGTQQAEPQQ